jgi:hypothetical protein
MPIVALKLLEKLLCQACLGKDASSIYNKMHRAKPILPYFSNSILMLLIILEARQIQARILLILLSKVQLYHCLLKLLGQTACHKREVIIPVIESIGARDGNYGVVGVVVVLVVLDLQA